MKNNKWIRVALTILFTLIVLVGVAGAGFRIGAMQSAILVRTADGTASQMPSFGHMQGFDGNFNNPHGDSSRMMQDFGHGGFERGGRGGFFSPLFGLIRLAVLGALLWIGYKFVKNSGWRITRAAPAGNETSSVEVGEKKESE